MMNKKIVQALGALESANGRLHPDDVVEAARDPASPLHEHFEWSDTEAAIKYRRDQARTLIRTVNVEVAMGGFLIKAPVYVHDPSLDAKDAGYTRLSRLRTDDDLARDTVMAEFGRAAAALQRAKAVAKVLGIESDLDALIAQIVSIRSATEMQPHPTAQ